ncbi:MAG: hypothetical protein LBC81_04655 [Tannerellaceae bacterium]|jgi:hypothetical protein|nr:hypothetical protein [Tannerellaceae bacterium]
MKQENLVQVLIPVYKSDISVLEERSLRQVYAILGEVFPMVIVKPESLNVDLWIEKYPKLTAVSFPNACFDGVAAYNRLMLSAAFYERFSSAEYILIHQLDAWIFRNELEQWCVEGYDYIGAPWLKKPAYNLPVVSQIMRLCYLFDKFRGRPNKQDLYNKVGNGGLSLRKVQSHIRVANERASEINRFVSQKRSHLFNEDVFWASVPEFSYPDVNKSLRFSFDKYPRLSLKLTGGVLPFGCHGWYSRKMRRFWRDVIGF